MSTSNWRLQAACLDQDTELFFPAGGHAQTRVQVDRAKEFCGSCPVRDACLRWAVAAGASHGVWGGLTEDERDARPEPQTAPALRTTAPLGVRIELRLPAASHPRRLR